MTILRLPPTASNIAGWIRDAAGRVNQLITALAGYQPLDDQLTDLAALEYTGNAAKVIAVTSGEDGFELVAQAGGGSGLSDGDYGDIVVSGTGTVLEFDTGVVTAFAKTFLDDANAGAVRTTLGLGTLATQSGTFSGTSSGTNTGDQTIALTGDATGTGTGSFATTLATVNANVGSFGSTTAIPVITVNAKGLITAVTTAAPAITFSGALVHKAADQTAANYSAGVVIGWDSEANGYDTATYHDTVTNNSRITIAANGKYVFTFAVEVSALVASDYIRAILIKNGSIASFAGSAIEVVEISATPNIYLNGKSAPIDCVATDYFEVWLDTESDTSITVAATGSWFSVQRVT